MYDSLIAVGFEKTSITHSSQKFPDFVLEDRESGEKLGLEAKKTDSAKWEVIGGSVYESLKNDIADTYVIMAKFGGGKPEVRLKRYEECIADLKVTHSPRFYLNMELEKGEDYLTKNDAGDLLELTGEELNQKIRKLLRTQKSTWWSEGETIAFSDLSKEEKGAYLNDGIALFPEVFRGDYQQFTPWLVYSCLVWCGNVRDIFSAGGNKYIEDIEIYVSAVMFRTLKNTENIRRRIAEMTEREQIKCWGKSADNIEERLKIWLDLVETHIKVSSDLLSNNRTLEKYRDKSDAEMNGLVRERFMGKLREMLN